MVVELEVQLTAEFQVPPLLPSQYLLAAWAAGALRATMTKKKSGDFLSFIKERIGIGFFATLGCAFEGQRRFGALVTRINSA